MKLKNTSSYEEDYRETSHPPCEETLTVKHDIMRRMQPIA